MWRAAVPGPGRGQARGRQAEVGLGGSWEGRPSLQRRFIEDLLSGSLGGAWPIGKKVYCSPSLDRERRAAKWPKIKDHRQRKVPRR